MLEGTTVLDLSSVGPAARCSRVLADYGADVVKIGPVPRHEGVQIHPPFHSYSAGRGYRRALFDFKDPSGRDAFVALACKADVVIESFRPGVVDRLGIGYADLSAGNPGLVYCSTSGYGQQGPASQRAGHDLNYLAVGGFLHCSTRRADGGPPTPGATVADSAAGGMQAAVAILAALLRRARTGQGEYLDVSVAEGVLALMALHIDEHLATGAEPGPGSNVLTGRYACYDCYQARDGAWLAVGAIEAAFWANLCRALGLDKLVERQYDDDAQDELRVELARVFAGRDRQHWLDLLLDADTCVTPVYSIDELVVDEQVAARGVFGEAEHPAEGRLRQVTPLLAGQERADGCVQLPDPGATHTRELLAAAGLGEDELEALFADGAVA